MKRQLLNIRSVTTIFVNSHIVMEIHNCDKADKEKIRSYLASKINRVKFFFNGDGHIQTATRKYNSDISIAELAQDVNVAMLKRPKFWCSN